MMFLLLEKKKIFFKVSLVSFLKHFNLLFKVHYFLPMISHGWKCEDTAGGVDLCGLDSCLGQCRPRLPTCLDSHFALGEHRGICLQSQADFMDTPGKLVRHGEVSI